MPPPPLPPLVDEFLRKPNPAVIASVRADGSPHTAATWYDWDGTRLLLNMADSRLRLRFLRHDPRVSLTILDGPNWYRHITVTGEVEELYADEDLHDIDRLSERYTGTTYGNRVSGRTSAWVRVTGWHGWDSGGSLLPR